MHATPPTNSSDDDRRVTLLTPEQKQEYISLMQWGAPPLAACARVGASIDEIETTLARDGDFAHRVQRARALLMENVAAAMYKSAMGGSVYAQSNYLRQCRPPEQPKENSIVDGMSRGQLRMIMRNATQQWQDEAEDEDWIDEDESE